MKSIKILAFGNSYSNDAYAWLYQILKSAGYDEVVLGQLARGGDDRDAADELGDQAELGQILGENVADHIAKFLRFFILIQENFAKRKENYYSYGYAN